MSLKLFYSTLLFMMFHSIYGQYDYMLYEPFEFKNYTPKWSYVVIDSTVIRDTMPTAENSIIHDGWLQFEGARYINKPIIDKDKLYIFERKSYNYYEGVFLACLDLKTGNKLWDTHIDLRNSDKKVYLESFRINNEGELELLLYKDNGTFDFWGRSNLVIRSYNKQTGELLHDNPTDPNDSLNLLLYMPISSAYARSFLFPNSINKYRYITYYPSGSIMKYFSYIIDKKGHVVTDTLVKKPFDLLIQNNHSRKIGKDKFFSLRRLTVQNPYNRKDTFKLVYNIFDMNLNTLYFKDISEIVPPAYNHELEAAYENYFILKNTDYIVINSKYVGERSFSLFDINGNVIENVTLLKDDGTPMLGVSASAIKLKYEDGMLVFTSDKTDDGFWTLFLFKSDGHGNLSKLKEIKVSPQNHELAPSKIYQLENGDILLNGMDFNHNYVYGLATFFAKFYMYIPANDLGLKTSSSEITLSKTNNISLYPNPAKDKLNISSVKENFNKIILYDLMGRKLYQEKFNLCDKYSVDIKFLKKGMYIVKFYINKTELETKKFIKG